MLCLGLLGCGQSSEQSTTTDRASSAPTAAEDVTAVQSRVAAGDVSESVASGPAFRFRAEGAEKGFDFLRYDDAHGQERILEVMGGGSAVFDLEADGWLDIWMSNGCRLPASLDSGETPGKLYRNSRSETWKDCSTVAGLVQTGFAFGCAAGDLNEDGFDDLYVARFGSNQLWLNNGDGTFRQTVAAMAIGREWSSSVAFGDLNADRTLDIFVGTYVEESDTSPRLCNVGKPNIGAIGCPPAHFQGLADRLLLSDGAGGFVDKSEQAGISRVPGKTLGVLIADLGGDFGPEVYVANDGEANALWSCGTDIVQMEDGITVPRLQDTALASSAAFNEQGFAQGSMGIAAADYDRNGALDLFLTHFYGESNTLYENVSANSLVLFRDSTRASGLGAPSLSRVGFGVASIDIDNNGWVDLVVANGHTNDLTWTPEKIPYRMQAQVFQNPGNGRFKDVSLEAGEYFQKPVLGRALAKADFDRDGRLDMVISHQQDGSVVLMNETPAAGNSLVLRLVGRQCTRTPIPARVTLTDTEPTQMDQLVGGGSYQAASAGELHFGLSERQGSQLTVHWPDGSIDQVPYVSKGWQILRQGEQICWPVPF
ncbi:MAG: CRTAC1 family protein [Planctomycetia bacterium]